MATLNNAAFIAKDPDGNIAYFRSLSENDINKIKQYFSDFDTLKADFEAFRQGATRLAFVDYTQTANQSAMEDSIIYLVPFNEAGEFIAFDSSTYQPASSGNPTDTTVAYVTRVIKLGDTVINLGNLYTQPDFDAYARLAGDNTYTGSNTFNTVPTLGNNTQTVDTIGDDDLVSGKLIKEVDSIADEAKTAADEAKSTAEEAKTTADSTKETVETIKESVETVSEKVTQIESSVETVTNTINTVTETVTTIQSTVTEITGGSYLQLSVAESAPSQESDVAENTILAYPAEDSL